jgi:hypothetical protein
MLKYIEHTPHHACSKEVLLTLEHLLPTPTSYSARCLEEETFPQDFTYYWWNIYTQWVLGNRHEKLNSKQREAKTRGRTVYSRPTGIGQPWLMFRHVHYMVQNYMYMYSGAWESKQNT